MNKKSNLSLLCKVKRTTLNEEAIPFQPGMASLFLYHIIFYFRFCLNQFAIWRSRWLRVLPPEMP